MYEWKPWARFAVGTGLGGIRADPLYSSWTEITEVLGHEGGGAYRQSPRWHT